VNKPTKTIKTNIIPVKVTHLGNQGELDYESICFFAATNFFLGDKTYFKDAQSLLPASIYTLSEENTILSREKWFEWHYSPRNISLDEAVDEFADLYNTIAKEQTENAKVVLPLSGGLDSRSQATVLKGKKNVWCYSYEYPNGIKEASFGEKIAEACDYKFTKYQTPKGYLWNNIEEIAELMQYGGDLTASRQAAFMDEFPKMGDTLFLGHWGDVLFDDMGLDSQRRYTDDQYVEILGKKLIKRGGLEFANALWDVFGLKGTFKNYFKEQILQKLSEIKISDPNAKVRAFKSLYWAPRWTSIAMPIFEKNMNIRLPYYDNRMCELICTIPEKHLAGRQIQIEYIKRFSPELAKIPWQTYDPLNLYNYHRYNHWTNIPNRIGNRLRYELKQRLTRQGFVTRNWELQFMGKENMAELEKWLFENEKFKSFLPVDMSQKYLDEFKGGKQEEMKHAISTFLTFSLFAKHHL